jgi:hypothetical protein
MNADPATKLPTTSARRACPSRVSVEVAYVLEDFLHDQRALARSRTGDTGTVKAVSAPLLDGRMWPVEVGVATHSLREEGRDWFRAKYGDGAPSRARTFGCVMAFLDRFKVEIVDAGLADECSGVFVVREELVRHLLDYPVRGRDAEIPRHALSEFLDSWGHRWM